MLGSALLAACGGGTTVTGSGAAGVVYTTAPVSAAAVSITDSSSPAQVRNVSTRADGSFSVDLAGLTPPYVMKVEWSSASGSQALYAITEGGANLDLNPITNLAVSYAAGSAGSEALVHASAAEKRTAAVDATAILTDVAATAAPLLLQYGITNLVTDTARVRTMLEDVSVATLDNVVVFSNRRSGGVIHRVPMNQPSSGTYDPSQLPGGRGASSSGGTPSGSSGSGTSGTSNLPANHPSIPSGASCTDCHGGRSSSGGNSSGGSSSGGFPGSSSSSGGASSSSGGSSSTGATLYASKCAGCHGALASSGVKGATASAILSKHAALVSSAEADSIAAALSSGSPSGSSSGSSSGGLPPAPPSGSSSGGTSSSDGATLYASKCAGCHGAIGSSTLRSPTASAILAKHGNMVTSAEAQAIAAALSGGSTSSSGGTASSSSGGVPPPPPGGSSSGASSGGLPPAPPGGSSSGGFPPPPPGGSSSGASSGGLPPAPPGGSSSGGVPSGSSSSGGSSSSTGSACGYGSNTAALAVTSGTKSATAGTYTAASADESGVCAVNSGSILTLVNPTITTSGNSSSLDNSSFYGQNAAALAYTGSSLSITGGTISSTGTGANGVFAYGTGTASLNGTTIEAKAQGGHGIMTAGGGTLVATNVTATTWGGAGSVIATDRGTGNKVTVTGGTFVAHGEKSAGVYSTGDITISDAVLTSYSAEGAVVEGKNSVTLNNCTVTSTNTSSQRGMFVYQSFSGDAAVGQGTLTLNGGSYTWNSSSTTGAAFYSTNTTAVIALNGVKITNPSGYLLHAEASSWGTAGSNGAGVTLKATHQTLQGDIVIDAYSTVAASFGSSSSYAGAINAANTGKAVSVALDGSSRWTNTGISYVHTLTGVALSGTTVTNIAGASASANVCYRTSFTDASGTVHTTGTYALENGGYLKPC